MAYNSILSGANPDILCQLAPSAAFVQPPAATPAYAATMTIDPTQTGTVLIQASGNANISSLSVGVLGQYLLVIWEAVGGTRTATFGTNFRSSGTAAPTTGKAILVEFVSDGTAFIEVSRSGAAV